MKKRSILVMLLLAALLSVTLFGCQDLSGNYISLRLNRDVELTVSAGRQYDIRDFVEGTRGLDYSLTAYYLEQENTKDYIGIWHDTVFTPPRAGTLYADVTATNGSVSRTISFELTVIAGTEPEPDPDPELPGLTEEQTHRLFEALDMTNAELSNPVPELYGCRASSMELQSDVHSSVGTRALKVVIPPSLGLEQEFLNPEIPDRRGIWTFVDIPFANYYRSFDPDFSCLDVRGYSLMFMVKVDNAQGANGLFFRDIYGTQSVELGLMAREGAVGSVGEFWNYVQAQPAGDGWYVYLVDVESLLRDSFFSNGIDLTKISSIKLTVTNYSNDTSRDATVYLDNVLLIHPSFAGMEKVVYQMLVNLGIMDSIQP